MHNYSYNRVLDTFFKNISQRLPNSLQSQKGRIGKFKFHKN